MSTGTMSAPINKLKKLRSLDEIRTRGSQALSAYREQIIGAGELPTSEKFTRSIDQSFFKGVPVLPETLWQRFFKNGEGRFFPAFRDTEDSVAGFVGLVGPSGSRHFIEKADEVIGGRIDLMGLPAVDVGTQIDWHREPISGKRSPQKHWKEFDDLDTSETGNKKILWELNRHQHFFTLGVAYWLTRDEKYAEKFAEHLGSWIEQNPPGVGVNWSSSLEVAFRAISWVWAFHLFQNSDAFSPALFELALRSLYCHGRHIEQYLSKYYSPNTHLTGEGLGLYYLGTQLPFLDRAEKWRALAENILVSEIERQVHPDGVYFEQSTWYQRYTADIYSHFAILRSLNAGPLAKPTDELETRLEKAFEFLMHVQMPDGRTPLIGDDDGGRLLPLTTSLPDDFRGSLGVGALLLGNEQLKLASGGSPEEAFWLTGTAGLRSLEALAANEPQESSKAYPDGGYFVARDGWSDTDNVMVIDCGPVGALSGGHGHADTLSIVAAAHGKPLLVDPGTYTYHDSKELRDQFRATAAHNTLVVDGVPSSTPARAFAWGSRAEAELQDWTCQTRFDHFRGSHDGYAGLAEPVKHTRGILSLKNDYWIVIDEAETYGRHDYSLNFQLSDHRKTHLSQDENCIGGPDHRIFTFGGDGEWNEEEGWVSTNHGSRKRAPKFSYKLNGVGTQEFVTFILPFTGSEPPVVEETTMSGCRAFIVKYEGYIDAFLINGHHGYSADNGMFESDFRLSWARIRPGERLPDEMVLLDGTKLIVDGKEVFRGKEGKFLSVRRLGDELYTKTELGRGIVTLQQ